MYCIIQYKVTENKNFVSRKSFPFVWKTRDMTQRVRRWGLEGSPVVVQRPLKGPADSYEPEGTIVKGRTLNFDKQLSENRLTPPDMAGPLDISVFAESNTTENW